MPTTHRRQSIFARARSHTCTPVPRTAPTHTRHPHCECEQQRAREGGKDGWGRGWGCWDKRRATVAWAPPGASAAWAAPPPGCTQPWNKQHVDTVHTNRTCTWACTCTRARTCSCSQPVACTRSRQRAACSTQYATRSTQYKPANVGTHGGPGQHAHGHHVGGQVQRRVLVRDVLHRPRAGSTKTRTVMHSLA